MSTTNTPERIMSRCLSQVEIAVITNVNQFSEYRLDLSDPKEALQVSGRCLSAGIFVPAHRHYPMIRETNITSEAWVIFSGKVECEIYDVDDQKLESKILTSGDCIVLFRGGHSLKVIDEKTVMLEFKNGPYFGEDRDKSKI